jgi:hypothetical protein
MTEKRRHHHQEEESVEKKKNDIYISTIFTSNKKVTNERCKKAMYINFLIFDDFWQFYLKILNH